MTIRRTTLKINAIFLMAVGIVQSISELLSHFLGTGPLAARFTASPYTIGFFEAHGLAALIGMLMFRASLENPRPFWHLFAVSVHFLLGGANLMFWDSFVRLDFVRPGIVATVFHGLFILAQIGCYVQSRMQPMPKERFA